MRRKTKAWLEDLAQRLWELETEFEGRVACLAEADERALSLLEERAAGEAELWEEMKTFRARLEKLETALDEGGAEQARAEREIQDGMDAIFNFTPPSMKGGDNNG